jgi:hypothetical protein
MARRLFEQGLDVDPLLTHRVASGLAGNTTKNHTWSKIVTWLNTQLQIPASQVTEETDLKFMTDSEEAIVETLETKQIIIDIGVWNMDTTITVGVPHSLDYTKIRGVQAWIVPDTNPERINLSHIDYSTGLCQGGVLSVTNIVINLERLTGGTFDSAEYDTTLKNRGYLLIDYIP